MNTFEHDQSPTQHYPERRRRDLALAHDAAPHGAAARDAVTELFARALAGDEAAELELGYRAFPWLPGGDGGPTGSGTSASFGK